MIIEKEKGKELSSITYQGYSLFVSILR